MATRPFPVSPTLTAIALAWRNPDVALIADDVLPRTPTAMNFSWYEYDLAQGFTVPETRVGRKSYPQEVEFTATEHEDRVHDHGLDDFVPTSDLKEWEEQQASTKVPDPRGTAVSQLTNLIKLGREIRVSNLVFNAASYAAENTTVLAGASQWSDPNSDAVGMIGDALNVPIMRPNIAVLGQVTWTKLRRNKSIVQAVRNTAQGSGMVSREDFAELFELTNVYVGQGFVNMARKGQPLSRQRVWGKHASFIYRDRSAGPQAGVTYGFTADASGGVQAGSIPEPKRGVDGGELVRVWERLKEIVAARDVGYYFQNAVA